MDNNLSNTENTQRSLSSLRNYNPSRTTNDQEYFFRYAEILLDYINILGQDSDRQTESDYSSNEDNIPSEPVRPTVEFDNLVTNLSQIYDKLSYDMDYIYEIMNIKYSKYLEISYVSKLLNLYRYICYTVCNIFKNCLVCGDIVYEFYLLDKLIDPKINILNLRKKDIFFMIDSFHSYIDIETITNSIVLLAKCTLSFYYQYDDRYVINLEIKNYDNETFYLTIHIFLCKKLYDSKYANNSPYLKNEKIKLNLKNDFMKKLFFLNKFKHNRLCMIKNNWGTDYVALEEQNDEYFLNEIEKSEINNFLISKKLEYIYFDESAVNGLLELETFFKFSYLKKKDSIVLSRLYNFINTIYILYFVEKGWTFNNIKCIEFEKNDSCYICSNDHKDFGIDIIYKISINCCKESINGICLNCFIKNVMENYKILKSYYSCPFCKKEHIFYNEKMSKNIENIDNI